MNKLQIPLLIALSSIFFAGGILAQNQPLACQVDVSAGLKWESGQWKTANFTERKFILVQRGDTLTKESVAQALQLGNAISYVTCSTDSEKLISCLGFGTRTLIFDPATNRGGTSFLSGTANGNNVRRDTPFIEAFTCQQY